MAGAINDGPAHIVLRTDEVLTDKKIALAKRSAQEPGHGKVHTSPMEVQRSLDAVSVARCHDRVLVERIRAWLAWVGRNALRQREKTDTLAEQELPGVSPDAYKSKDICPLERKGTTRQT